MFADGGTFGTISFSRDDFTDVDTPKCSAASLVSPLRSGETINEAILTVRSLLQLPLFAKRLMATLLRYTSRPAGRNDNWASLVEVFHPKTATEERELVVQRDAYRAAWHRAMKSQGIDFVLTVPHSLPPIPKGKTGVASLVSANYAFLYNVVSSSAILHFQNVS